VVYVDRHANGFEGQENVLMDGINIAVRRLGVYLRERYSKLPGGNIAASRSVACMSECGTLTGSQESE